MPAPAATVSRPPALWVVVPALTVVGAATAIAVNGLPAQDRTGMPSVAAVEAAGAPGGTVAGGEPGAIEPGFSPPAPPMPGASQQPEAHAAGAAPGAGSRPAMVAPLAASVPMRATMPAFAQLPPQGNREATARAEYESIEKAPARADAASAPASPAVADADPRSCETIAPECPASPDADAVALAGPGAGAAVPGPAAIDTTLAAAGGRETASDALDPPFGGVAPSPEVATGFALPAVGEAVERAAVPPLRPESAAIVTPSEAPAAATGSLVRHPLAAAAATSSGPAARAGARDGASNGVPTIDAASQVQAQLAVASAGRDQPIGTVSALVREGELVSVRLGDLVSLYQAQLEHPLFVWMSSSAAAGKFVDLRALAEAGLEVEFDASEQRLSLKAIDP